MNEIALILPCYNEAKRLKIDQLSKFISVHKDLIDFYFVDDGSTDDTANLIKNNFSDLSNAFLIQLDRNHGKGNAVRIAVLQNLNSGYKYFGFIDSDLDIPLAQVINLHCHMKGSKFKAAVTNRRLKRKFNYGNLRSYASLVMVKVANSLIKFEEPIRDTQCGCKLFRADVIELCFNKEFISEWLFDIEIFLRLKKADGLVRNFIVEVPVEGRGKSKDSRLKLFSNLKVLEQLYRIKKHYE